MPFHVILTLGPSTEDGAILARLARTATAFRLNGSHLDPETLEGWLHRLARVPGPSGDPLPLILDLQGEKMRIGRIDERDHLAEEIELRCTKAPSSAPDWLPVPHPELFRVVETGDELRLNDGRILLHVTATGTDAIRTKVKVNGPLSSRKGINRSAHPVALERLLERDRQLLAVAESYPFVSYACSFVRGPETLKLLRPHTKRPVVAKIERIEAMERLQAIDERFDGLWFCRGDLGSQVGLPRLGPLQSQFERDLPQLKGPSLLAGQVFEHLTAHEQPTRSEVVHFHDCRCRGWAGIVLSDETAVGAHPLRVVELLDELLEEPIP